MTRGLLYLKPSRTRRRTRRKAIVGAQPGSGAVTGAHKRGNQTMCAIIPPGSSSTAVISRHTSRENGSHTRKSKLKIQA